MEEKINNESVVVNIHNEIYIKNNIEQEKDEESNTSDWMKKDGLY